MNLAEGDLFDGRYRVEHVIAIGKTSTIVRVKHIRSDQRCALKVLHPDAGADSAIAMGFRREARALAMLQNEHTCRVSDFGQVADAIYAGLEYCDGLDLARVLEQRGRLSVADAVDYIAQASEAVGEAHALGMAHGKLAAGKLIVTAGQDGRPWIKVIGIGGSTAAEPRDSDFSMLAEILDATTEHRRPVGFADVLAMCRAGDFATVGQFADALAPFAAS